MLHAVAKLSRPAIVSLPADDIPREFVEDDSLAKLVDINDIIVLWQASPGKDSLRVKDQSLDRRGNGLVCRPGSKLNGLDEFWQHGLGRVGNEVRQPRCGGEIVPCRRGVAVI